ncbi:phage holin [Bacillus tianshenii]|nr:phage holin [Bacillus tianshenii]
MSKIDVKSRLRSYPFWVALFSLTGLVLGRFDVIDAGEYQRLVDAILSVLVAGGIVIDPATPGIGDGEKSV